MIADYAGSLDRGLEATAPQTDSLLERVLSRSDSLQTLSDASEISSIASQPSAV